MIISFFPGLVLLVCVSLCSFAVGITPQPAGSVRIDGMLPGGGGEEVRLIRYKDRISNQAEEIAADVVADDGRFGFSVEIEDPQEVYLRVFHSHNPLYIMPGGEYTLSFAGPDEDHGFYPMRHDPGMEVECTNCGDNDINKLVSDFNAMVGDYLETYVAGNIRANHSHSLSRFIHKTDSLFGLSKNEYFSRYRTYYTAYLKHAFNTSSDASLIESYIIDRPLLHLNPMYSDFAKNVLGSYIFGSSRALNQEDMIIAVNHSESFSGLMETLGRDSLLMNERIRELAALAGLQAMLNMDDFDNEKVIDVLKQAARDFGFKEHSLIAENIAARHARLRPGSRAPDFTLYDSEGRALSLDDFRGRYLYLIFWATWCPVSMSETGPAADLHSLFGDRISFLAVFTDREGENAARFTRQDILPFRAVHFGSNYRFLDDYRVWSVPQYILVGPDGRIVFYPFVSPSGGAGERLRSLTR